MKPKLSTFITGSIALAAGLALVTLSCNHKEGNTNPIPKSSEPIPVKVMALTQSTSSGTITASGQLTTDDETTLAFKTGGVVNAVLVKEGDPVRKGQLLATLDLTEINAQVAQARHGHEKAQRDLQRATNLYKDSVATLEQLQNAQTALSVAKEQLDAATFNRSFSEIHAPANGYVLRKFVNAGQVVATGDPIVLTNGAARGKWILKAGVSDKQWAVIKPADAAIVHIDAFPDKPFNARVIRKAERSDPQTGAFTLELEIVNEGVKLATGMFASAEVRSGKAVTSWSVPYEAVLDAHDNAGFVFITNDDRTAIRQPVTIESFDGTSIRISKGLDSVRSLIISGSAYLSDRSPIQIVK